MTCKGQAGLGSKLLLCRMLAPKESGELLKTLGELPMARPLLFAVKQSGRGLTCEGRGHRRSRGASCCWGACWR